jgi:hypothetical protein
LTAYWSINGKSEVADSIRHIFADERTHFGLACNLLTAIGGEPILNTPDVIPQYPGPLPGGVNPDLIVSLQGLSLNAVKSFLEIEKPEFGPITTTLAETFPTIGAFYTAIQKAFDTIQPSLSAERQISGPAGINIIGNLK